MSLKSSCNPNQWWMFLFRSASYTHKMLPTAWNKQSLNAGKVDENLEQARTMPVAVGDNTKRQSSTGSWFDEIDLTTAEWLWKQVLIGVSPDLGSIGWGVVPSLPDFTHQVDCKDEKTTTTEKFTIGDQSFEWYSLPSAHLSSAPEQPPATSLDKKSESNLSPPLKEGKTIKNNQLESRMVNLESLQRGDPESLKESLSLQTSSSSTVKECMASQKSFTKSIKVPQSLKKGLTKCVKEPPTSQKESKKATQDQNLLQRAFTKNVSIGESKLSQKQTGHLWPAVSLTKNQRTTQAKLSAQGQTSSGDNDVMEYVNEEGVTTCSMLQESTEKVTDVAGSLETCPICLLQFPKQFTQLDMDSHLAQCLSETTIDVVW